MTEGAEKMPEKFLLLPGIAWLTVFFIIPLFSLAQTSLMTAREPGNPDAGFAPDVNINNYTSAMQE